MSELISYNWESYLTQWSIELLTSDLYQDETQSIKGSFSMEAIKSTWLGYPKATELQIEKAEKRLGVKLPPSYRQFLKISNGWPRITYSIFSLLSTEEIVWFSDANQELIDIWVGGQPFAASDEQYLVYGEGQGGYDRFEYLQTALQISGEGEQAYYLLNPKIITDNGEWEAWFFAEWLPGTRRYRSFWELMQAEHQIFLKLKENEI